MWNNGVLFDYMITNFYQGILLSRYALLPKFILRLSLWGEYALALPHCLNPLPLLVAEDRTDRIAASTLIHLWRYFLGICLRHFYLSLSFSSTLRMYLKPRKYENIGSMPSEWDICFVYSRHHNSFFSSGRRMRSAVFSYALPNACLLRFYIRIKWGIWQERNSRARVTMMDVMTTKTVGDY